MKCMLLRKRAPFSIGISGLLHLDDSRTPAVQFICTITHNNSRSYGEKKNNHTHKKRTSLEKKNTVLKAFGERTSKEEKEELVDLLYQGALLGLT